MADNNDIEITSSNDGRLISASLSAITDLVSGSSIPAPIKKNALKAFSQLCTAAIDIPVAYLEGIAAEKRAESEARIKIITASAEQIAAQVSVDPAYARAAVKRYGQKIIQEQVNLDAVSEVAAEELNRQTVSSKSAENVPLISEDWLNQFEKEASQKSTVEMQLIFGRILAGEIQRPTSFSIRTVKLLGSLDSHAALLFKRLCSLCIVLRAGDNIIDARVASLGENAGANSLQKYGLGFDQLNILHEYGLIIPDYNSWFDYRLVIADPNNHVTLGFEYQGGLWGLATLNQEPVTSSFQLYGISLSRAGRELLSVVELDSADDYTSALQGFLKRQNFRMLPVTFTKEAPTS